MSSLLKLLPTSKLGLKGETPPMFDLGPNSTLHYESSLNGRPAFTTYSDPYLRGLKPTGLKRLDTSKYLDNPPK